MIKFPNIHHIPYIWINLYYFSVLSIDVWISFYELNFYIWIDLYFLQLKNKIIKNNMIWSMEHEFKGYIPFLTVLEYIHSKSLLFYWFQYFDGIQCFL